VNCEKGEDKGGNQNEEIGFFVEKVEKNEKGTDHNSGFKKDNAINPKEGIRKVHKQLEKPREIYPRVIRGGIGIKIRDGDLVVFENPFPRFQMPPDIISPKLVGDGEDDS